jgi:hypothetical protein
VVNTRKNDGAPTTLRSFPSPQPHFQLPSYNLIPPFTPDHTQQSIYPLSVMTKISTQRCSLFVILDSLHFHRFQGFTLPRYNHDLHHHHTTSPISVIQHCQQQPAPPTIIRIRSLHLHNSLCIPRTTVFSCIEEPVLVEWNTWTSTLLQIQATSSLVD